MYLVGRGSEKGNKMCLRNILVVPSALVAFKTMVLPATVTCLGVSSLCAIEFEMAARPSLNRPFRKG